ncbi:hypothetical protein KAU15_02620 [candidate division WOR-3 bacterium]|nr:hypothetical protein [candidate division WOR-3 bacterium]
MKKKELLNIVQKRITRDYPEFEKIKPIQETISTAISKLSKKLGITGKKRKENVYAFVYIKNRPIRSILRITIDANGKIIKISHSK